MTHQINVCMISRTHQINVCMISRDALLLPEEATPDSHNGTWYYDPKLYPNIAVGDDIVFSNNGEIYARGNVIEIVESNQMSKKYCSGINSHAFRWKRLNEKDSASG